MEFVTLEIAKKLKSKGFKEKCLAHYDCYGVFSPSTYIETWDANNCEDLDYTFFLRSFNEGLLDTIGIVYDAPTISQVFKWLREEKKLFVEVIAAAYGYIYIISDTPDKGGTDREYSLHRGSNDACAWDDYKDCVLDAINNILDKNFEL